MIKILYFLFSTQIWDVLTNHEVISIVASAPRRSIAAKLLVKRAVKAWRYKYPGSKVDDCAAICLFLNEHPVQSNSQSHMSRQNRKSSKNLHHSKTTRNEDTDTVDGKVGLEIDEEWKALGGYSRANSLSKLPRLARGMSKRQSSKYYSPRWSSLMKGLQRSWCMIRRNKTNILGSYEKFMMSFVWKSMFKNVHFTRSLKRYQTAWLPQDVKDVMVVPSQNIVRVTI